MVPEIIMGNSCIGPRYPNYPKYPKNNPAQIYLFIATQPTEPLNPNPTQPYPPPCRPEPPPLDGASRRGRQSQRPPPTRSAAATVRDGRRRRLSPDLLVKLQACSGWSSMSASSGAREGAQACCVQACSSAGKELFRPLTRKPERHQRRGNTTQAETSFFFTSTRYT